MECGINIEFGKTKELIFIMTRNIVMGLKIGKIQQKIGKLTTVWKIYTTAN